MVETIGYCFVMLLLALLCVGAWTKEEKGSAQDHLWGFFGAMCIAGIVITYAQLTSPNIAWGTIVILMLIGAPLWLLLGVYKAFSIVWEIIKEE